MALLAPLLIADVPPVLDYPNHLARLVLLAAGPDDPVLGRIFTPHWAIIPDLAIDVIGPPLLRLLPVHVAGRCLLALCLLLNLAGGLALHRTLFGRRSFWALGSFLVADNSTFLLGFLNWEIGSGLAMLGAAAWLTWRDARPRATILGAALAGVLLFFCHLVALAFFLLLIGSAEAMVVRSWRQALQRAAALLAVLAPPLLLFRLAALRDAPAATHWMSLHDKLVQAASPVLGYWFALDMASAALLFGGVALGLAAGWLVAAPRMVPALAALPLLYAVLPFDLMGASFVDTRVAVMAGFLLFAAIAPLRLPARLGWPVALVVALLFAGRMTVLANAWAGHRRDLAELRQTIAAVPPGATVFLADVSQFEAPAYWDAGPPSRRLSNTLRMDYHLPALLLIERGAFWPVLFANPAQQPIMLRPAYARLARIQHDTPRHAALRSAPDGGTALAAFDFVLLLEAGADPDLAGFLPHCLTLLSQTDFAALFRVRHGADGCAAAE